MANETSASAPPASQNKGSQGAMSPGMVMGPDGKPCKICTAFRNWSPAKTNIQYDPNRPAQTWPTPGANNPTPQRTPQTGTFAGFSALAAATAATAATAPHPPAPASAQASTSKRAAAHTAPSYRATEPPPGCPPDVEQLGRATWTFLHTTAAYYPEKPTPMQRANMLMLLGSLPVLYPCGWCAKDFGENMKKSKPDVSGRVALSSWLCDRHNEVNEKLGKDKFDCAKVDERWKDGPPDGSCD